MASRVERQLENLVIEEIPLQQIDSQAIQTPLQRQLQLSGDDANLLEDGPEDFQYADEQLHHHNNPTTQPSSTECEGFLETPVGEGNHDNLNASSEGISIQFQLFKFLSRIPHTNSLLETLRSHSRRINERKRRSRFYGWRMGVLTGSFVSALALCCNITLVIVGATRFGGYDNDGIGNLVYGDDLTISRWNTVLHVFINVLSSALLAGSNYTMQVLSSPTRQEIDQAHTSGSWVEVGILSSRNLRRIARKRAALCLILALSSIPLHLVYNASIFKVLNGGWYDIRAISKDDPFLRTDNSLVFFDNEEWYKIFNQDKFAGYFNLILVVDEILFSQSAYNATRGDFSMQSSRYLPWYTRETETFTLDSILATTGDPAFVLYNAGSRHASLYNRTHVDLDPNETPDYLHIMHGLARPVYRQSRVEISLLFMMIVITFNSIKLTVMVYVLVTDHRKYVVTLGDASASFLEHPDRVTEGNCIAERDQMILQMRKHVIGRVDGFEDLAEASLQSRSKWNPRKSSRSLSSTRVGRGLSALVLFCSICVLLFLATIFVGVDFSREQWSWGASAPTSLFANYDGVGSVAILMAWLVNLPQALLSLCYLSLNSLCTAIAGEKEWNNLTQRKALRVTQPEGQQRSTYFLQVPYKFALPLIALSTVLHWLLSETFFLVRIDWYDDTAYDKKRSRSICGFSLSSSVAFGGVCLFIIAFIAYVTATQVNSKLPPADNCSLMISAACHPAPDEVDPHLKKVQWGVVTQDTFAGHGHCSLSSKPVARPEIGKEYH